MPEMSTSFIALTGFVTPTTTPNKIPSPTEICEHKTSLPVLKTCRRRINFPDSPADEATIAFPCAQQSSAVEMVAHEVAAPFPSAQQLSAVEVVAEEVGAGCPFSTPAGTPSKIPPTEISYHETTLHASRTKPSNDSLSDNQWRDPFGYWLNVTPVPISLPPSADSPVQILKT